jgi:hypothetical protein
LLTGTRWLGYGEYLGLDFQLIVKKPLEICRGNPLSSSRAIGRESIAAAPRTVAPPGEPTTLISDQANTAGTIRICAFHDTLPRTILGDGHLSLDCPKPPGIAVDHQRGLYLGGPVRPASRRFTISSARSRSAFRARFTAKSSYRSLRRGSLVARASDMQTCA